MKALLDTNIIIHREAASSGINQDIGILFKWLDKVKYTKCIHPLTVSEIEKNPNKATVQAFKIKMSSYELMQSTAPLSNEVKALTVNDKSGNDKVDTALINELFNERVDLGNF